MDSSYADSVAINNGSVVGLPNSSSDDEDSTDELTRAGDALCRTLLQEQQKEATENADVANEVSTNQQDKQIDLAAVETKSDSSRSTNEAGNGLEANEETNENASGGGSSTAREISLEERVAELEIKLATLSRILQQQQKLSFRSLLARSPTGSQRSLAYPQSQTTMLTTGLPEIPSLDDVEGEENMTDSPQNIQKGMVPYLESPAPMEESPARQRSMHGRKRLSFHLLYDGDEENLGLADDDIRANRTMQKAQTDDNSDDNINSPNEADEQEPPIEGIASTKDDTTPEDTGSSIQTADDHGNNQKGTITVDPSPKREGISKEQDELKDGLNPKLVDVAACVVKSQMQNEEQKGKAENISESSRSNSFAMDGSQTQQQTQLDTSQSKSMDESQQGKQLDASQQRKQMDASQQRKQQKSEQLDGSQKRQPTTPISNGSNSSGGKQDSKSSTSFAPAAGHVKAIILPPLPPLVAKDTRTKWLDHLNSFQESNHDVDRQMQDFIKVPGEVEKTMASGLLICVDSFLYVWTILPVRFAWSCVLLSLHYFFKWTKKHPGTYQFHRRHTYQLIQVSILFFIYRYILLPISIGKLYHWIRGQAMIKLYVFIAIVEVFDRLMCSLGQDCLDSLYWNTTRRPRSTRMLISVSVVMVYTAVHSLILFVHVATLNVAMNSADEALLALLIGGNFAEIKSTVFKKYNKASLFKIVASDICERFKLALFLGLVLLLNFCQGMDSRKMSDYQRIAGFVWMSELLCDWLKHAFITKFNFIPSTVYSEYGLLLAGDVTGIGHEGVNLDHSHAVVKRIGFAQMPLVCVMARLVREAAKYISLRIDSHAVQPFILVVACAGSWILLLVLKIMLGSYLQRTSLAKLHAAPELSQTPLKSKHK